MSEIEKAVQVVKSECYVFNPLNMDRTTMVNKALDTLIEAAKRYDESCKEVSKNG